MSAFGDYIRAIPPSPQMIAEREYIAKRAPKLAGVYLTHREHIAAALDDIAAVIASGRPMPADLPLVDAIATGTDAELGGEIRRAIELRIALQADIDASDEASEMFDHMSQAA